MEALTPSEREMTELARQSGVLGPQDEAPVELLEFALSIVHACAQIGDGYWSGEASAGQHIRAFFWP